VNTKAINKEYFNEIHFLRAFACIGVLFVHVSATYYTQAGEVFNWFTYFFNQLGRFGTPTFAVISGFLLFNQVNKRGFLFKQFVTSRTTKIILPFIIWSLFYQFVTVYIMGGNLPADPKVLLYNFTLGQSFYHLYFMAIVVQFYLLFPLLQLIRNGFAWWIALGLSALSSYYFFNTQDIPYFTGIIEKVMIDKVFLFHWIFYFIFGGFLAYYWKPIASWTKKNTIVLAIVAVAVYAGAIYEYNTIGSISSRRVTNLINIPLLSFATIGLYRYMSQFNFMKKSLQLIGKFSMGIYLLHPFVLIMFIQLLPAGVWQTRIMPIMFFAVLLGSLALVKLIQQVPKHQYIIPIPARKKKADSPVTKGKPVSA
jgi:probable poly-beta-1,6-N-acetyl-D-glucosamine export protein